MIVTSSHDIRQYWTFYPVVIIGSETEHERSVLLWRSPPPGNPLTAPVEAVFKLTSSTDILSLQNSSNLGLGTCVLTRVIHDPCRL